MSFQKRYRVRWGLGLLVLLVLLLILRLMLPYGMCIYINHKLENNPVMTGKVHSVSLAIWRGQMEIHDISLKAVSYAQPQPSVEIEDLQMQLDWANFFKGHLDMRLDINKPKVFLLITEAEAVPTMKTQPTDIWQSIHALLLPVPLTDVTVYQGTVHYIDQTQAEPFDLYAEDIDVTVTGLQELADQEHPFPSHLSLKAKTVGDGMAKGELDFNLRAHAPTFKLAGQLEHVQLNQLNPLFKPRTDLRIKEGEFNFYIEALAQNGQVKGYAKPFFENLQVTLPPAKQSNPFKQIYKGIANWFAKVFANNDTNKVATQIEFQGDINEPDTSLWSIIGKLISNAFWRALMPGLEARYE